MRQAEPRRFCRAHVQYWAIFRRVVVVHDAADAVQLKRTARLQE